MLTQTLIRQLVVLVLAILFVTPATLSQDEITRKVKTKADPVYPALARSLHLSGTVRIQVTVAPNGTIKSTKVIGGNPVLVQSALQALEKWKFEPANEETTGIIPFKFEQ